MAKANILVIDSGLYCEMIEDVLEEHVECNLLRAADGEEGLKLYREHHISLVIMEVRVPKMNGVDFLRAINLNPGKAPIIVQSGYASEKEKEECLSLGIDAYLEKPLMIDQLIENVKSCLQSGRC